MDELIIRALLLIGGIVAGVVMGPAILAAVSSEVKAAKAELVKVKAAAAIDVQAAKDEAFKLVADANGVAVEAKKLLLAAEAKAASMESTLKTLGSYLPAPSVPAVPAVPESPAAVPVDVPAVPAVPGAPTAV